MTEFSRQEIPLEGSYISPLMSIFDVPSINSNRDEGTVNSNPNYTNVTKSF